MYACPAFCSRLAPLRNRTNTRYGWVASPYPTGTFTRQETPSFARRDNVKHSPAHAAEPPASAAARQHALGLVHSIGNVLKTICQIVPCGCSWQGLTILVIQLDDFIHKLLELLEHRQFIIAVAAPEHKPWATPHVALVFF